MKLIDKNKLIPSFGKLLGYTAAYGQQELSLLQIQGTEKGVQWVAKWLAQLIFAFLLLCGIGFGSVALALFLGELLHSYAAGFGIVAISFIFFLTLGLLFPKQLVKLPLQGILLKSWTKGSYHKEISSLADLQKEKQRLQLASAYAKERIDLTVDSLLIEINDSMNPEDMIERVEQNIRHRVELASEQLQQGNTNNLVTLAHLIEAIGQLRRKEN